MGSVHGTVNHSLRSTNSGLGLKRLFLLGLLLVGTDRLGAVERILRIDAPKSVVAGHDFAITLFASTDAGQDEQVGFLQAEYSIDQGKTWTAICYLENAGPQVVQPANLKPASAGSKVLLRVRAAFRDGLAGDVDQYGAAIRWHEWWASWAEPGALHASVTVRAL